MPTCPTSWYNLPRNKGIAYAAQESWIQNETIKVWLASESIILIYKREELRTTLFSVHLTTIHVTRKVTTFRMIGIETKSAIVIYQCALEHDLELFDAGDLTEVGEKGITLRCVLRPKSGYDT